MLNEKLDSLGTHLHRLTVDSGPNDRMVKTLVALDIIRIALDPACHDGLTIMCREANPPELIVFETEGERKPLRYGGVGSPDDIKVIGSDGPLTFIVGLCLAARTVKMPLPEVVNMLIALAKAVFSGYHEAKGEGR